MGFPCGSDGKESACSVGDPGSIPGLGISPGEWHGNPLQHSCLENPTDRGALPAGVHGAAKSQTWLSDFPVTFTICHCDYTIAYCNFISVTQIKLAYRKFK